MMTHTPGPWEIKANLLDIETRYGDWHYIDIKGVALVRDPHTPEGKANATLIAAAPDLLAACDDAVAALMLLPPDCLDDVAGQPSRDELINNIFSAIARARPE